MFNCNSQINMWSNKAFTRLKNAVILHGIYLFKHIFLLFNNVINKVNVNVEK